LVDDIARNGFVGETLETIFAIMFGETTRRDPARAPVAAIWHERIAALPPGLHHAIRGVIDREDATALLAGIRVPVLVISGAEDPTRPPAWSEELAAAIPDAELWRLEGVGHSPVLEAPETVVPRVLDFFARSAVRSRA
jgi:3-oxoadipate enol-lactonase